MKKKTIEELKTEQRAREHELEGHVIDALENGAPTVIEVIEYCKSRMKKVNEMKAVKMTYQIMGVSEKVDRVPKEEEAVLL